MKKIIGFQILLLFTSCATTDSTELTKVIESQKLRIQELESQLGLHKAKEVPVIIQPPSSKPSHLKLSGAFEERFEDGVILLKQKNYPEAVILFSNLIETFPNHALTPSAAFQLTESYFAQNDFQIAKEELLKYIAQYPYSPHISFALKKLQICYAKMGESALAVSTEKLLKKLFPYSQASLQEGSPL